MDWPLSGSSNVAMGDCVDLARPLVYFCEYERIVSDVYVRRELQIHCALHANQTRGRTKKVVVGQYQRWKDG
jgi:hypothetical protein